ncbi:Os08g0310500 [Oryza sativa Japonica Group]|uniref:Os08g0310500 protein n=1 Tax=Oryza sativa subsp. japonica TaxID=39947 RepID=A0A0P0XE45_ORYSJ|nr:Os08g0310500 [Oryza sativa Japonica Group]
MASLLPRPVLPAAAAASTSSSSRCRYRITTSSSARGWSNCQGWRLRHRVWAAHAADQQGGVQQQQQQESEDDVVDSNVLPYCSINRKEKKTIGEMAQEFLSRRCRPVPCPSLLLNPATSYHTYYILTKRGK